MNKLLLSDRTALSVAYGCYFALLIDISILFSIQVPKPWLSFPLRSLGVFVCDSLSIVFITTRALCLWRRSSVNYMTLFIDVFMDTKNSDSSVCCII